MGHLSLEHILLLRLLSIVRHVEKTTAATLLSMLDMIQFCSAHDGHVLKAFAEYISLRRPHDCRQLLLGSKFQMVEKHGVQYHSDSLEHVQCGIDGSCKADAAQCNLVLFISQVQKI